MSEERRVVTVIFVGLLGVEGVSSPDPEDAAEAAAEVVDAVFTRFRRVIEARGGTVDKFVGDTVMGVFGAPIAHEDDPLRAVRSAVALKRELELFNAQRSTDLKLRVGVNQGEVLWGTVGGDRATAMGDAVNVAQRLQSEALPGEVLVGRAVVRATSPRIEYGAERELHLRGRQDAVGACVALRESEHVSSLAPAELAPARLVGRTAELERLVAALTSPSGAFVVLEADSGVGKSRLSAEVRGRVRQLLPDAWIGLGHAQEGSPLPLGPFAEIVRAAARAAAPPSPGDHAAEAAGTRAFVSEVLAATVSGSAERSNFAHLMTRSMGQAAGEGPLPGDASRARAETLEAWERWMRGLAKAAPVLICLEDLHWADPGTFALLDHLAAKLKGERVSILATTRPAPRAPGGFERVKLGELNAADAAILARELFRRDLDPDLTAFLVEQSAGNPLYMEELIRFLRIEGLAEGDPVRFSGRPDRLPDGLRGLLVSRIDAVSPEAREALKCGSIFGRAFWSAATGNLAGHDVAPALEQAGRRHLVERSEASLLPGDEEFVFRQHPLRDAAYSLLTKKERQRLHLRAASILEPLTPHLGRRALILTAGHRELAGQTEEAAKLWARAAAEANTHFSSDEALDSARNSQRLMFLPEAAMAAVRALLNLGITEQAVAEAEEFAAMPGLSPLDLARARNVLASAVERRGDFARCLSLIDQALEGETPPGFRAFALANRSNALFRLSRFEEALAAASASAALAPEIEKLLGTRESLSALGRGRVNEARCLNQLGRLQESLEAWQSARTAMEESGDRVSAANALNGIGNIFNQRGETAPALAAYEECLATFRELGDRSKTAMALTNIANVRFETGEIDLWRACADEALRIRRDLGERWGAAFLLGNVGEQRAKLGEIEAGMAELSEAYAEMSATGDRQGAAVVLRRLAGIRADAGEPEKALAEVDRALAEFESLRAAPRRRLGAWIEKSVILLRLGRTAEARELAEAAMAGVVPDLFAELGIHGWTTLSKARNADGDKAGAIEAARRAAEVGASLGDAQTPGPRAELLLLEGGAPERARALYEALKPPASLRMRMRVLEVEAELRIKAGDKAGAARVAAEAVEKATACGAKGLAKGFAKFRQE